MLRLPVSLLWHLPCKAEIAAGISACSFHQVVSYASGSSAFTSLSKQRLVSHAQQQDTSLLHQLKQEPQRPSIYVEDLATQPPTPGCSQLSHQVPSNTTQQHTANHSSFEQLFLPCWRSSAVTSAPKTLRIPNEHIFQRRLPVLSAGLSHHRHLWSGLLLQPANKKLRQWLRLRTAASPLVKGKVSARRPVPANIPRPPYVASTSKPKMSTLHQVHDAKGIERMRAANKLAAQALSFAGSLVAPGITTDAIDAAVHDFIISHGAYPSPLGYGGFPKSICTSVNECACHGVPDDRPLQDGDVISIDVSCYLNGYHGDNCRTYAVGEVSPHVHKLIEVTKQVVDDAVALCGPGVAYSAIGNSISSTASKHGLGIVRHFVGHGLGQVFHSHPVIYPYANSHSGRMVEGETFTIEPILALGHGQVTEWEDGWTSVTVDRSITAQFEHAVLVTADGVEVLTGYE